jgi:N-acetylglucosaminyl-diphospho-decaprenol L-rhamnosyltransferase
MDPDTVQGDPQAPSQRVGCVDVVIVSADMAEMTLACVEHLADASVADVVVIDNAFAPEAGAARAALRERATVLALDFPHGFAAANNRGLALGQAPYALLLNSDILTVPGAIDALLAALDGNPGAVAAGGRLVDPDTLVTQEGYRPRPFPGVVNFLVIVLGIEEWWPGNPVSRRYHGSRVADTHVQAVAQPAAAALMVRRSDMAAVGGFDERFWFWFEDSDLLLRLSARGDVLYVPQAVFRHLGGGTFSRWSKSERIRSAHHGMLHFADAHLPRLHRAVLGVVVLLISAPRIALFHRSRPAEARAWRAVASGGLALVRGGRVPVIAPGPPA